MLLYWRRAAHRFHDDRSQSFNFFFFLQNVLQGSGVGFDETGSDRRRCNSSSSNNNYSDSYSNNNDNIIINNNNNNSSSSSISKGTKAAERAATATNQCYRSDPSTDVLENELQSIEEPASRRSRQHRLWTESESCWVAQSVRAPFMQVIVGWGHGFDSFPTSGAGRKDSMCLDQRNFLIRL